MYATQVLARHAAQSAKQALPPEVTHHACRAVIDWHASLYPGLGMPAVTVLERAVADDLGRGTARLADGRAATPRAAALIHGTAAHAAELDDSFREAMVHPGAATIAAALAAGQMVGATGPAFLRAVVLGYEVATRIGTVMGRAHYQYWHSTGTIGSFGAAAAAASLLKVEGEAFAHALALTATFTAGLQQAFRLESMGKPLHAGRAAEAGLLAARLAAGGMRSSLDVLEGEAGLGRAMRPARPPAGAHSLMAGPGRGPEGAPVRDEPDWASLGATLGRDFHITRLSFKNHVGCGHVFPSIDGVLELQRHHGFSHEEIDQVSLGVYQPALDIAPHTDPQTAEQARFSLSYMVASALVHGSVRLAAFEPDRLEDPATRALMTRIHAARDAEVDAAFPARRGARIEVALRDGRRFTHLQSDRKGDPELPLSDADLEGKLIEMATPVIGEQAARALLKRIWALPDSPFLP